MQSTTDPYLQQIQAIKKQRQAEIIEEEEEGEKDAFEIIGVKSSEDQSNDKPQKEETDQKDAEKSVARLDKLAEVSDFILYRAKTANPLDPFPDEIIIDSHKISVIHNIFFASARVHSILITDVSDVFIDTGIFFAKLSIVDRWFAENTVRVEYLSKDDAMKIRRIVQGLVVAKKHGVDVPKLKDEISEDEIIEKVEKLGQTSS